MEKNIEDMVHEKVVQSRSPFIGTDKKRLPKIALFVLGWLILLTSAFYAGKKLNHSRKSVDTYPSSLSEQILSVTPKQVFPATEIPRLLKNQIVYAKQIDTQVKDERSYPVYSVFTANRDGSNKRLLFTAGDKDNYPSAFTLIKERNLLIVNFEYRLVGFNLITGEQSTLYLGEKQKNYIFGYAISHDKKKIALNVSTGAYHYESEASQFQIVVIDLESNSQKLIASKNIEEVGGFWLTPTFWSFDDKAIYLYEAIPAEHSGSLWRISEDGRELKKLPVLPGKESNDGSQLAYLDYSGEDLQWICVGNWGPDTLNLFNLKTTEQKTIDKNIKKEFSAVRWSPDSKQFIYAIHRYQSGEGCLSKFYPEQTYVFDTVTRQSKMISSTEEQLKSWYPDEPKVEVKEGVLDSSGSELLINDAVVDTTDFYPRNIIYIGYF